MPRWAGIDDPADGGAVGGHSDRRRPVPPTHVRARVLVRIERLAVGNPGDVRPVGEGVSELRIDYGTGLPGVFQEAGPHGRVLLAGGNKGTQSDDIDTALRLARNLSVNT